MDCIVHEVTKIWTQLSDFHFHFSTCRYLIFFFNLWTIFEVFIEYVTTLLLFYVWGFFAFVFVTRHVGSLLPDQESNLHPHTGR